MRALRRGSSCALRERTRSRSSSAMKPPASRTRRACAAAHDLLVREAGGFIAEDDRDLVLSRSAQELPRRSARIEQAMGALARARAQSERGRPADERLRP